MNVTNVESLGGDELMDIVTIIFDMSSFGMNNRIFHHEDDKLTINDQHGSLQQSNEKVSKKVAKPSKVRCGISDG